MQHLLYVSTKGGKLVFLGCFTSLEEITNPLGFHPQFAQMSPIEIEVFDLMLTLPLMGITPDIFFRDTGDPYRYVLGYN